MTLRTLFSIVCTGCVLLLGACIGDDVPIGGDDAAMRDGGSGEPCGPTTCSPGTVCCNASCGVCVPPGVDCTTIACEDGGPPGDATSCVVCAAPPPNCRYVGGDCSTCGTLECDCDGTMCGATEWCDFSTGCGGAGSCEPRPELCATDCPGVCGCDGFTYCNACDAAVVGVDVLSSGPCPEDPCKAQDIRGEGPCTAEIGVFWNGTACVSTSGCSCAGADCADIFATTTECEAAYAGCLGGVNCGTIAGLTCADTEWCDYSDSGCGFDDGGGVCRPRPDACPPVVDPVCGCDGTTYNSLCEATAAGVDALHSGVCTTPGCAAMDARGEGLCAAIIGVVWDGTACVAISGCSCVGTDCGGVYADLGSCEADYAACISS